MLSGFSRFLQEKCLLKYFENLKHDFLNRHQSNKTEETEISVFGNLTVTYISMLMNFQEILFPKKLIKLFFKQRFLPSVVFL